MVQFRMFGIHLDQFAILAEEVPSGEMEYNIELSFRHADAGKKIACSVRFDFRSNNETLLVIKVACEFEIADKDWQGFVSGNVVTIPKELLEYFAVHTIGTVRGIMYCKTERTSFSKIIIPPLNVSSMIKGNVVIDLKNEK